RGPEPPHPRRDALPHVLPGPRDRRSVAAAARPVLLRAPMTQADLPPYDPARILSAPFPEKIRLVCTQWASQVNPTPMAVMALYWAKYLFVYIGGWAIFQMFNAGYPGLGSPLDWAFSGTAFQKAVIWSI